MMELRRLAATFTVLKGTERVIHAMPLSLDKTPEALELYELMMLRRIRRAIHDRLISGIESGGNSFYLFVGSVLHRLLESIDSVQARVCHLRVIFGPAFEALKLLRQGRQACPIVNDFWCVSGEAKAQFLSLHGTFEHLPSSATVGTVRAGKHIDETSNSAVFPAGDLIVIDLFKSIPDSILDDLSRHFSGRA